MGRVLRVAFLLFVLLVVAQGAWLARARTTEWREPLRVTIYPINGDGSAAADAYPRTLARPAFEPIEVYMRQQAAVYQLPLRSPVEIYLAPRVDTHPPLAPFQASALEIVAWSLRLRFWAWRNDGSRWLCRAAGRSASSAVACRDYGGTHSAVAGAGGCADRSRADRDWRADRARNQLAEVEAGWGVKGEG